MTMARASTTYTQGYNSIAYYKGELQPLSGIINTALGARTSDTGQLNWANITTEPTVVRDYEVFTLGSGALQSAAPIYMRFDYQGATNTGGLFITVGTSTDGAGNIGGVATPKLPTSTYAHSAQSNLYAWAASDQSSYFTLVFGLDPLASGPDGVGIIVVERTRDGSGNPTTAGFHCWRWYMSSTINSYWGGGWSRTFAAQTQTLAVDFNLPTLIPDPYNTNSAFVGTTSYAMPVFTYTLPFVRGASKAILLGYGSDFPRGQAVTLNHYGENMTFIPLADAVVNNIPVMTSASAATTRAMSPLIRWD